MRFHYTGSSFILNFEYLSFEVIKEIIVFLSVIETSIDFIIVTDLTKVLCTIPIAKDIIEVKCLS